MISESLPEARVRRPLTRSSEASHPRSWGLKSRPVKFAPQLPLEDCVWLFGDCILPHETALPAHVTLEPHENEFVVACELSVDRDILWV